MMTVHHVLQGFKVLASSSIKQSCSGQLAPNTSVRNTNDERLRLILQGIETRI
jgi:hypothetical protein